MSKKIIRSENQFNRLMLLKEYMDKYHAMSDEEKEGSIIWWDWRSIPKFLSELMYDNHESLEELGLTDADYQEIILSVEHDDDTLVDEILTGRFQQLRQPFAKWLISKWSHGSEGPSWLYMEYPKQVHNEWLIHFSNNAREISWEGFKHGTDDLDRLAYSYAGETDGKFEGYDFAYTLEGARHYAFLSRGAWGRIPKYGHDAVIFRASGVKLWHSGDQEEQVVFYGPSAKDIIYLHYDDETSEWNISSRFDLNHILYHNEDIDEVINWIENNYDQYRKLLSDYRYNKNYETNYNRY